MTGKKTDTGGAIIAILITALVLTACTTKIEKSKTVERNGLVYAIGAKEPFTGIVMGISRNEDYRKGSFFYKKEYENGLLNGRSYYYYPDETIESVEPYTKGVLDGVVTRYHENGQLKARIHFLDGYRGGPKGEMFWDENGERRKG